MKKYIAINGHLLLVTIIEKINRTLQIVGGFFLCTMVILTTANIIGRKIGLPISGSVELIGLFSALVISASLALTQSSGGHIAVNILTEHFSIKIQKILAIINAILCSVFFIILAKSLTQLALRYLQKGEITETLHLPIYPFVAFSALGVAALALSLVVQISELFHDRYKIEYQGDKG